MATTGEPVRFTNEAKALDGRWFDVYAFRVGKPEQKRVAILFTDITERKRVEEERDRYFSVAADMLVVTGTDGRFVRANPAWHDVFGWTSEEMTSRPWLDFVHPEDREVTVAEAARLFEGGDAIAFENRYRAKDGSYRWLRWKTRPFAAEGLLYAAATDITEQKELERALRHRARELAEADRRRTSSSPCWPMSSGTPCRRSTGRLRWHRVRR